MRRALLCLSVAFLASCTPPAQPDYTLFERLAPRSILVLPPLNETADLDAARLTMSTLTFAPAERGYYVFPIAIVDRILRDEGAPSPVEMRQISYRKLKSLFGADTLLDVVIETWGTQYLFLSSVSRVRFRYSLIDLGTSSVLWSGSGYAEDSSRGSGNILDVVVEAALHAAISTATTPEVELSKQAHAAALMSDYSGLLRGPRLPSLE